MVFFSCKKFLQHVLENKLKINHCKTKKYGQSGRIMLQYSSGILVNYIYLIVYCILYLIYYK